jgi:hypothetical protein
MNIRFNNSLTLDCLLLAIVMVWIIDTTPLLTDGCLVDILMTIPIPALPPAIP